MIGDFCAAVAGVCAPTAAHPERRAHRGKAGRGSPTLGAAGDGRALPAAFLETLTDLTGGLALIAKTVNSYTIGIDLTGRPQMQKGGKDLLEDGFLRAVEDFRTSYDVRTRRGYTGATR